MADILLISKPVEPPWNDGSKTLVRDLSGGMTRHTPVLLGRRRAVAGPTSRRVEPWYGASEVGHALSPLAAARVFARLALGSRIGACWHFFFQPNLRTSRVARAVVRGRRMPSVHTVPCAPLGGRFEPSMAFADRTVVLSRHTEALAREGGVRGVVRIGPAVAPLDVPEERERAEVRRIWGVPEGVPWVVFPGDLERGDGAARLVDSLPRWRDARLGLAFRHKGVATRAAAETLRVRAERLGVERRIDWIGETPSIHAVLGAADIVALPSRDLGAKVDLPIVLIEAMWRARPIVVAAQSAAEELCEDGGARAVAATPESLVDAVSHWLEDDDARRAAGARARTCAAQRFHPSVMAAAYEALYDEVLR